jgi:hypothetical protein
MRFLADQFAHVEMSPKEQKEDSPAHPPGLRSLSRIA